MYTYIYVYISTCASVGMWLYISYTYNHMGYTCGYMYWHVVIHVVICIGQPISDVCWHRSVERWGAGVEYHFQEI